MPYKKRPTTSRRYKKKPVRKYRRSKRSMTTTMQKGLSAIADSQIVRLRYGERIQINSGIATPGFYVFRANSVYDPNYTAAGHQPYAFDQWSAFYNHYLVLGAKIKVIFAPRGAGITNAHLCNITLRADAAQQTQIDTAVIENPKAVWGLCGGLYSKGQLTLSKGYSPKTFFGKSVMQLGDTTGAAMTASPAEEAYFHLNVSSQDDTTDADTVDCIVQIDYLVRLSERKQLVQS